MGQLVNGVQSSEGRCLVLCIQTTVESMGVVRSFRESAKCKSRAGPRAEPQRTTSTHWLREEEGEPKMEPNKEWRENRKGKGAQGRSRKPRGTKF